MTNDNVTISQTNRNFGIDLLIIISMPMVVILHVLGQGGVLESTKLFSPNYMITWFLEIAAYCAVNCYALISGYVGYESKHKFSNLFHLLFHVAKVFPKSCVNYTNILNIILWHFKKETFHFLSSLPLSMKR